MLKIFGTATLLAVAGVAFAQTSPGTPSSTPSVTPSQTPAVTPSQTPSVSSTPAPVTAPSAIGGLGKCENMIGAEKDTCLQQERAGTGSTGTTGTPDSSSGTTGTVR